MCSIGFAQSKISTDFYILDLPNGFQFKEFNKSREENSNSDVYEFLQDGKPKYLLYLLSNKLNDNHTAISIENIKNYVFDIGDLNILNTENVSGKIKIVATSNEYENLKSIIYVFQTGNILNRFLFLFPNEEAKSLFAAEVEELVKNHVSSKRTNW